MKCFLPSAPGTDQLAAGTTVIWHVSLSLAATITDWETLNLQYLSSAWLRLTLDATYTSNTAKNKTKTKTKNLLFQLDFCKP